MKGYFCANDRMWVRQTNSDFVAVVITGMPSLPQSSKDLAKELRVSNANDKNFKMSLLIIDCILCHIGFLMLVQIADIVNQGYNLYIDPSDKNKTYNWF
jgi:hypothetical protein